MMSCVWNIWRRHAFVRRKYQLYDKCEIGLTNIVIRFQFTVVWQNRKHKKNCTLYKSALHEKFPFVLWAKNNGPVSAKGHVKNMSLYCPWPS